MPRAASGEPSRRRSASVAGRAEPGRAVTWARTPSLPAGSSGDVLSPAPSTVTPSSFHSRPGATPPSAKVTVPDLSASRASFTRGRGPAGGPRGEAGGAAPTPARRRCRIRGLLGGRGSGGGLRTAEHGEHVDVPLLVARGLEAEAIELDGAEQHVARRGSPSARSRRRAGPPSETAPGGPAGPRTAIPASPRPTRSTRRSASPARTRSSLRVAPSLPVAGTAGRSGGRYGRARRGRSRRATTSRRDADRREIDRLRRRPRAWPRPAER